MTVDECIKLAERECLVGECINRADCDWQGECTALPSDEHLPANKRHIPYFPKP